MSHTTTRKTGAALLLTAALAAPMLATASAEARGGDRGVRATGTCTGGGTWTLKAKHDAGRIEVEFEVDTNRAGQVWLVAMSDNKTRIYLKHRTTLPPSGSFTSRHVTLNRAGVDVIRARAIKGARMCAGSVRL